MEMTRSPFPGMDPFIEARGLWADFHHRLVTQIGDAIAPILPPRYVARFGHRTYIDHLSDDAEEESGTHFEPDVSVVRQGAAPLAAPNGGQAASEPDSVIMHSAPPEVEVKEVYLDIFDLDADRKLVTSVEVLSPANKRFHGTGWKQYQRKRDLLLLGRANLVEIDLLRGGRRRPMREPWPDSPYYVLISRKWEVPACHVHPAFITQPLPFLRVPLERGETELEVSLQSCVEAIYDRSRYWQDISR
jgi:hypothetical protein